MNAEFYNKSPEARRDAELIASFPQFEYGQALLRVTQAEIDMLREDIELNPVIGCENVKQDARYKLGVIAGLRKTISRPTEAQNLLDRSSQGG